MWGRMKIQLNSINATGRCPVGTRVVAWKNHALSNACFIKCMLYQMHALSNVCFTKCVWAAKEHIWSRFGASKIQSNIGKCSLLECHNDLHDGFNCSDFVIANWPTFKMTSFWQKITFKTAIFGGHFRPPKKWSLNWTCSSRSRGGLVGLVWSGRRLWLF